MILRDSIHIRTTPEAIFAFIADMEQQYVRWHPDHVLFKWVSGRGLAEGNVFYFEERIAGKLFKKRVVFTKIVPREHIEFAPIFWLMRLFLPRILFRIVPDSQGCELIAELYLRIGPLAAWANKRELDAVRQHMREEGENMKRMLEQA